MDLGEDKINRIFEDGREGEVSGDNPKNEGTTEQENPQCSYSALGPMPPSGIAKVQQVNLDRIVQKMPNDDELADEILDEAAARSEEPEQPNAFSKLKVLVLRNKVLSFSLVTSFLIISIIAIYILKTSKNTGPLPKALVKEQFKLELPKEPVTIASKVQVDGNVSTATQTTILSQSISFARRNYMLVAVLTIALGSALAYYVLKPNDLENIDSKLTDSIMQDKEAEEIKLGFKEPDMRTDPEEQEKKDGEKELSWAGSLLIFVGLLISFLLIAFGPKLYKMWTTSAKIQTLSSAGTIVTADSVVAYDNEKALNIPLVDLNNTENDCSVATDGEKHESEKDNHTDDKENIFDDEEKPSDQEDKIRKSHTSHSPNDDAQNKVPYSLKGDERKSSDNSETGQEETKSEHDSRKSNLEDKNGEDNPKYQSRKETEEGKNGSDDGSEKKITENPSFYALELEDKSPSEKSMSFYKSPRTERKQIREKKHVDSSIDCPNKKEIKDEDTEKKPTPEEKVQEDSPNKSPIVEEYIDDSEGEKKENTAKAETENLVLTAQVKILFMEICNDELKKTKIMTSINDQLIKDYDEQVNNEMKSFENEHCKNLVTLFSSFECAFVKGGLLTRPKFMGHTLFNAIRTDSCANFSLNDSTSAKVNELDTSLMSEFINLEKQLLNHFYKSLTEGQLEEKSKSPSMEGRAEVIMAVLQSVLHNLKTTAQKDKATVIPKQTSLKYTGLKKFKVFKELRKDPMVAFLMNFMLSVDVSKTLHIKRPNIRFADITDYELIDYPFSIERLHEAREMALRITLINIGMQFEDDRTLLLTKLLRVHLPAWKTDRRDLDWIVYYAMVGRDLVQAKSSVRSAHDYCSKASTKESTVGKFLISINGNSVVLNTTIPQVLTSDFEEKLSQTNTTFKVFKSEHFANLTFQKYLVLREIEKLDVKPNFSELNNLEVWLLGLFSEEFKKCTTCEEAEVVMRRTQTFLEYIEFKVTSPSGDYTVNYVNPFPENPCIDQWVQINAVLSQSEHVEYFKALLSVLIPKVEKKISIDFSAFSEKLFDFDIFKYSRKLALMTNYFKAGGSTNTRQLVTNLINIKSKKFPSRRLLHWIFYFVLQIAKDETSVNFKELVEKLFGKDFVHI